MRVDGEYLCHLLGASPQTANIVLIGSGLNIKYLQKKLCRIEIKGPLWEYMKV